MRLTRRRAITMGAGAAALAALLVAGSSLAGAGAAGSAPTHRHSGTSGWMVIDLDSGEILDQHLADTPFAPASVAKLPTTLYALERLGPDYRFETRVAIDGLLEGETLEGDLILLGGGDPELDTDDLLALVTQVGERGLRRITGNFLVDGSAGPHITVIDADQPVDAAYNPSLSGLNLNFNRVRLIWDARGKARWLRVSAKSARLDPEIAGVRVELESSPGAPMFSHSFDAGAEVWRMSERGFRGRGGRWLPVRRPDLYAGGVFQTLARTRGLALGPAHQRLAPEGAQVIARHQSRRLMPMLKSMLRYSTNLTAEMVGLAASRAGGAAPATLEASAAAMNAWAAEAAGIPPGDPGFRLVNHSGLSTDSRLSPRRMAEFLAAMARRHPERSKRLPRLPGGLTDLLQDYNVAARSVDLDYRHLDIAAKTGSMNYVRGLAGYIATPSGRRLAFAIFSNDLGRRELKSRRGARRWMARARAFGRSLIRNWVLRLEG